MSRIHDKNTAPELAIRRLLFAMGYRFRLHVAGLPGKPDVVFPGRQKIIFVHGCFWHGHLCNRGNTPKSNKQYWQLKIANNRLRDKRNRARLSRQGWKVLVIWECEMRNESGLRRALKKFLQ